MSKRIFDLVASLIALLLIGWLLLLIYCVIAVAFQGKGLFCQRRIGRFGKPFTIFKFRTMHPGTGRISGFSKFLRDSKIDEMPQLLNVLKGDMSFVGPRPDIAGYYDLLKGEDRKILELRPGITSPASLKYSNEEKELAEQLNPLQHNDQVIFPDKIKMNLEYYYRRDFWYDLKVIVQTVFRKT